MRDASAVSSAPSSTVASRRSARNYLIDRNFQLKYAGILAGATLMVSSVLGWLLFRASSEVIEQGQKTVERGQLVLQQSRKVSQVVAMNIAREYKDEPELAKTYGEEVAKDEQRFNEEQARLERDAASLATQQKKLFGGLVAMLSVLVIAMGLFGIVFTHKVAGPIFKMKRLLRQVGEGKLVVRESLRKGDELKEFFEVFEHMVASLRQRQEAEMAKVDAVLAKLCDASASGGGTQGIDPEGIELLKRLRRDMGDTLEG